MVMPFLTGEFIASGSDDGRWFIWEKRTGRLIKILAGDDSGTDISFINLMHNFLTTL